MKLATSGEICRVFMKEDPDTIIRRPNLRRFARDNGIEYYINDRVWLIHREEFFAKINPRGFIGKREMPRMRHIQSAVQEWNTAHPRRRVDKHIVELCMKFEGVFHYYHGNRWIINYDQLESVLAEYMKDHVYIPMKIRIKKGIPPARGRKTDG